MSGSSLGLDEVLSLFQEYGQERINLGDISDAPLESQYRRKGTPLHSVLIKLLADLPMVSYMWILQVTPLTFPSADLLRIQCVHQPWHIFGIVLRNLATIIHVTSFFDELDIPPDENVPSQRFYSKGIL